MPCAEQVADDLHAVHERPLDHLERPRVLLARFFDVGLDEVDDAVDQRVGQALLTGASRQARSTARFVPAPFTCLGELHQAFGRVGPPVEQHVLDRLEQFGAGCPRTTPSCPALTMPMSGRP